MAIELSRIDRKTRTYALTDVLTGAVPPGVTGVDVALLPPRSAPTAATVWYPATYASGSFTVLLAGPDADSTGALVVPASADIWMRITNAPEVDAERLERITVLGGAGLVATPVDRGIPAGGTTGQVLAKASNTAYDTTWVAQTGGGGSTDPEIVRDTIAAALVAGTNVTITPNDGADTITIAASGGAPVDATTSSKGVVQLAGDLGGTAAAPTVPALANKVNSSTYTAGLALKADTASLAAVAQTGSYTDLANKPTIPADRTVTVTTVASATGAQTLTLPAHADSAYNLTLTGNVTLTPTGGTAGELGTITVVIRQDATAGRTVTFGAAVAWPGQAAPVLNVSAGKYDVVTLTTVDGGTTWIGALVASAVQPVTAPAAPVSLAASPGSTQVVLNWADAGNGGATITGHKVYRGTTSGGETLLTTLGAVSTYTDTGLTNGTTYYYKVTAVNAVGESVQSAEIASIPGHYLNVTTGGANTPVTGGMTVGAGTLDIRALIQMSNWVPSGNNFVLSQWGSVAANNRFTLYVDNAGKLNGAWYDTAGVFQGLPSTVATNQPANGTKWVRALMNPTGGTCTYYLSDDGTTWTQLGSTITGLTTTGVQTTGTPYALTAGQTASATGQFTGRIYKAQMLVGGTSQASVNYTTATAGASTVTGAQGETWTTIAPAAVV